MMIRPAFQERMANTIKARTVEVPSSHVFMLSHPEVVADTIVAAASAIH